VPRTPKCEAKDPRGIPSQDGWSRIPGGGSLQLRRQRAEANRTARVRSTGTSGAAPFPTCEDGPETHREEMGAV